MTKTSNSEPKANRTMCSGNEVAKVAKPSDMVPKRCSKHNAGQTMPNENEESNISKPAQLKSCCKQTTAQPIDNDDQEMHAVSSEIDFPSKVSAKAAAASKVVSDKPHKWRWRIKKPPTRDTAFKGERFSKPPENFGELRPIDYFKMFWTDNITNLFLEQTKLYSTQLNSTSISTSSHETERFLGMHVLKGIMKLPVYDMYYAAETRYAKIGDVMSNKTHKQLM